ncbi:hypothetical protein OSTOST_11608 [Ostertagia ostertagi]
MEEHQINTLTQHCETTQENELWERCWEHIRSKENFVLGGPGEQVLLITEPLRKAEQAVEQIKKLATRFVLTDRLFEALVQNGKILARRYKMDTIETQSSIERRCASAASATAHKDKCRFPPRDCYYCERIRGTIVEDLIPKKRHHRALCEVPDLKNEVRKRIKRLEEEIEHLRSEERFKPGGKIVGTEEFYRLTFDQLVEIISSEALCVSSEEQIFEVVVQWVKFDLKSRKQFFSKYNCCMMERRAAYPEYSATELRNSQHGFYN